MVSESPTKTHSAFSRDEIDEPYETIAFSSGRISSKGQGKRVMGLAAAAILTGATAQNHEADLPKTYYHFSPISDSQTSSVVFNKKNEAKTKISSPSEFVENARFERVKISPLVSSEKQAKNSFLNTKRLRAPYMPQILHSIEMMGATHGQLQSAMHIDKLFTVIKTFTEISPYDPLTRVLLAFYDSLAFEDMWSSYSTDQFQKAHEIISRFSKLQRVHGNNVAKTISDMDAAGFSTIPFSIDFSEIEEG